MEEILNQLLKTLQDFEELKVSSKTENGTTSITIEYNGIVEDELNQFIDFLTSLDDDAFIGTCEFLGGDTLQEIQNCLDSGELNKIKEGIFKFKKALSDFANEQIRYWEKYV